MDENIARGKSQEAIKAACIFIACKEHNSARTFKEICNLTKVSKKELGRTYKQIRSLLTVDEGEISYESHVHRVSSQLDLPQEVISSALKVHSLLMIADQKSQKSWVFGRKIPNHSGGDLLILL